MQTREWVVARRRIAHDARTHDRGSAAAQRRRTRRRKRLTGMISTAPLRGFLDLTVPVTRGAGAAVVVIVIPAVSKGSASLNRKCNCRAVLLFRSTNANTADQSKCQTRGKMYRNAFDAGRRHVEQSSLSFLFSSISKWRVTTTQSKPIC
jgi:hypothetical protein